MSNSLDPSQARCFVGPDLGPDCLQRFSADVSMQTNKNGCSLIYSILAQQPFCEPRKLVCIYTVYANIKFYKNQN